MMKILAVIGSPRKGGNTDVLMGALVEGAQEAGAAVEKVYVADLKISPCDSCDGCKSAGECIIDDDMIPLYDKLFDSDVWVLGTPIYWWGPSAQLKAFIDRWYRFSSEKWRVNGKRAALVSPFEDSDSATSRHVVGMLADTFEYLKIDFAGKVLVTAHKVGDVAKNQAALQEARELGKRLATG